MLAVLLLGLVTAETAGIISSVVRQVDRVRLIDNSSSWDVHVVGTNKKLQEAFSSSYAVTSTVSEHSVVICIDFAQYVHPSLHGSFACDLVQARPRMVVFASATEGEGELRPPLHAKFVGEAKFSFWIDHFQRCNYSLDTVSTVRARNYAMAALGEEEDLWYFAKNVLFFYPALPVDSTDTYSAALRQVAKLEMASLMASIHHALSWFSTSESPGVPIAFQKLFEADGIAYRAIIQRAENKLYPNVYDEGRTYPKNDSLSILGAQETASMMLHLYTSRNFAELTKQLQRHLELLEAATVYDPQKLNTWVQLVLFLLSRHDFEVSDVESSLRILRYAGPLCHAIRLSGAASADATISTLSQGDNTVLKLLLLLTPYSKFELHAADMWPNYAILADVWLLHVLRLCAKGSLASLEFEIRVRQLVHELVQVKLKCTVTCMLL